MHHTGYRQTKDGINVIRVSGQAAIEASLIAVGIVAGVHIMGCHVVSRRPETETRNNILIKKSVISD